MTRAAAAGSQQPFGAVLITCEHAGNKVPRGLASLFRKAQGVLGTHRGYDRGALPLARAISKATGAPLLIGTYTRLLVDLNRSADNPGVLSRYTEALDPTERAMLIDRYWSPHREAVERAAADLIESRGPLLHLGVHTFTPVLRGQRRDVDIGLLYDPSRPLERQFCTSWLGTLAREAPRLRLKRNAPYTGTSDGLTTTLRSRFAPASYAGIELEVNQRLLEGAAAFPAPLTRAITSSFASLLS